MRLGLKKDPVRAKLFGGGQFSEAERRLKPNRSNSFPARGVRDEFYPQLRMYEGFPTN